MSGILKDVQRDAVLHLIKHTEYALHQMKIIEHKLSYGEDLTRTEEKFLEGYLK